MIKALVHTLQRNLLPTDSAVAGLARLREAAVVRILVAIDALFERNARILGLAVGSVGVALGALYLRMEAGKRITGLTVIELPDTDLLPVFEVVAGDTVLPEPALVEVLMAVHAPGRYAQK